MSTLDYEIIVVVIGMTQELIKKMRLAGGYSQVQLAQKLGIASTTLSGYERGGSMPNFDMVVKIADLCDFDLVFIDRNSNETLALTVEGSERDRDEKPN